MPPRLHWPTQFPRITQEFGKRPDFYKKFNLPGHEGLDFAAPAGSEIYACMDGVIKEIIADGRKLTGEIHPYGIHIRIEHHIDGLIYQTIYAHLMRPESGIEKGVEVKKGQLIARADNTGNSSGDHLHLTLKKIGATVRGETHYPSDIIDPTPFLEPFTGEVPKPKPIDRLSFLEDVTVPDDSILPVSGVFIKTWRVRNSGTSEWGLGYKLVFISNTPFGDEHEIPLPPCKPGEETELTVPMVAPFTTGKFKSTWQAQSPDGTRFGTQLFALIRVIKNDR